MMTRLFETFKLREFEVRNRLWVAPMCQYSAGEDGIATEWHRQHLGALARGGAGLICIESTAVLPEGRISPADLGLWNEEQAERLGTLVEVVHGFGARIGVQLNHAGRKASVFPDFPGYDDASVPFDEGGWPTAAPSAVEFEGLRRPAALLPEEIATVEGAFLDAADRAVRAGVDLVEIHAAHGYLLHQFLSPFANLRTDEFGGGLESRARLLRRIVSGIRTRHPRLALSVRISATEWLPGGFDLDEAKRILPLLAQDGADFISVTTAGNHADAPIPDGPGYQVPFAAGLSELDMLPIGVAGNIDRAEQAEQILVDGQADVVLLGRPLLGDPFLPLRWARRLGVEGAKSLVPDPYSRADFR